jgi:hypothetical protein
MSRVQLLRATGWGEKISAVRDVCAIRQDKSGRLDDCFKADSMPFGMCDDCSSNNASQ